MSQMQTDQANGGSPRDTDVSLTEQIPLFGPDHTEVTDKDIPETYDVSPIVHFQGASLIPFTINSDNGQAINAELKRQSVYACESARNRLHWSGSMTNWGIADDFFSQPQFEDIEPGALHATQKYTRLLRHSITQARRMPPGNQLTHEESQKHFDEVAENYNTMNDEEFKQFITGLQDKVMGDSVRKRLILKVKLWMMEHEFVELENKINCLKDFIQ